MTMKRNWLFSASGIVAALVVIILANYVLNFARQRIDLTDGDVYTLSDGTRKLLKNLKEPVRIKYYFNQSDETVPIQIRVFGKRVDDFLNEYKSIAGDKLVIERLNPTPDSDAEDQATVDGVESQMLPTGDKFYLGLALSQGTRKAVLPSLIAERERLLEYDLTRAIARVTTAEKPVIGVMSPLGLEGDRMMAMRGMPMVPQTFYAELQQNYDVKRVGLDAEKIDDAIKTLLVIHPRGITDQAQYALDQFVLRGGRLIAFVDPHAYFDQIPLPGMPPQGGTSSSLDKLFKAWGITMENKVVLDLENAAGGGGRVMPTVLALDGPALNRDDVSTSMMANALIPMSGAFGGKPIEGLKMTVLLKSSKAAQLVEGSVADKQGQEAMRDFKAGGTELPLAIKLAGRFKTAFPDGKPKPEEKKDDGKKDAAKAEPPKPAAPDAPQLKEAKEDNTVVLIADSDFMDMVSGKADASVRPDNEKRLIWGLEHVEHSCCCVPPCRVGSGAAGHPTRSRVADGRPTKTSANGRRTSAATTAGSPSARRSSSTARCRPSSADPTASPSSRGSRTRCSACSTDRSRPTTPTGRGGGSPSTGSADSALPARRSTSRTTSRRDRCRRHAGARGGGCAPWRPSGHPRQRRPRRSPLPRCAGPRSP